MKKDFLKYGNLIGLVAVIVLNVLAATGILGGVTTKEVSDMNKSLLTPESYAFSIWSVIYILLAILVYLQMVNKDLRDKLSFWFILSCALNIGWIFAWQFELIGISFVLIFILLINLILLMRAVKEESLFPKMAVGLYTGWINVAMLANLGALFARYNWTLFGINPSFLAVAGLAFGILWISFFIFAYSNIYYTFGAFWGYLAIAVGSDSIGIQIMAILGTLVFAIITVSTALNKNSNKSVDISV